MIIFVATWMLSTYCVVMSAFMEDVLQSKIDPCCEHLRVNYKQRVVYQILNVQHEDLKAGINCFQRVCPSQFPAFYRVMYVGGLPGMSVSFAVCSSDNEWAESNQTRYAARRPRRRVRRDTSETLQSKRHKDIKSKPEEYHPSWSKGTNSQWIQFDDPQSRENLLSRRQRRKRESVASRTIFEIPEPRPSIVYTLTGVCFCLRVVSKRSVSDPTPKSNISTSENNKQSHRISRRNPLRFRHLQQTAISGLFTQKVGINDTRHGAYNLLPDQNSMKSVDQQTVDTSVGSDHLMGPLRNNRNPLKTHSNSFLDSFVNLVIPKEQHTYSQTFLSYKQTSNQVPPSPTSRLSQANKRTHLPMTSSPRNSRSSTSDFDYIVDENPIVDVIDSFSSSDDRKEDDTDAHKLNDNATGDDDVDDNDDDKELNDEFADRLVVFASFSHDVHFIGTISMEVSVATSCRSNTPVVPDKESSPNGPSGNPPKINLTSPRPSSVDSLSVTPTFSFKGIPGNGSNLDNHGNNTTSRDTSHISLDILLVWQVTSGGLVLIFLVVTIVLCVLLGRKRNQQRKRYMSPSEESRPSNLHGVVNTTTAPDYSESPPTPPLRSTSTNAATLGGSAPSSAALGIQRGLQSRTVVNATPISTVYPMHMRLRSLSAAKEAARLRGQEALRMLNNESSAGENSSTGNIMANPKGGNGEKDSGSRSADDPTERRSRISRFRRERGRERSLNPKIIVSNGSTKREFDLGKFAVYRNDIVLKLRSAGLRPGKKTDNSHGNDRDYDNMELGQDDSVYACYAGGETDI